jgi:phage-related minor tail protein
MSNDTEIVVQLTAETAQLQAGMAAGTASVARATEAMAAAVEKAAAATKEAQAEATAAIVAEAEAFNAAVQAKITAQTRLNAAFATGITSAGAITEAESALDAAMATGAISATEYAGFVARLNEAELAMVGGMQAATVATTENTTAMAINGGVARELGVMIGELARGNYTRLEGSTITLANRTGALSGALGFLISPLGLAAEATAALGFAAYQASLDEDALRESIINTGNISGYNVDQLRTMEQALRDTGATAGEAKEAVLATASSGNLLGANFQNAAQAAVDMAQLTGISIEKAVAEISKLEEDPVKAIQKLNEKLNFLSPAEAQQIRHLADIGDKAGAAARAIEDLAEAEGKRVKEQRDAGGGAEGFAGKLKSDLSGMWAGVKDVFSTGTLDKQLGDVNAKLQEYAAAYKGSITQDSTNAIKVDSSKLPGAFLVEVNRLLEQREALEAQITAQGQKQEQQSAKAIADKEKVNAVLAAPKTKTGGKDHGDHDQAQADRDEYNAQRLQHDLSLADEKRYWESKKAAAKEGTQAYRQAVEQLLEIKNKEATAGRVQVREEISDAKHAAAEKIRAAKEVARDQELAQERQRQLSLEKLQTSHAEAAGDLETKRQQYQLEYSEGQINAEHLLQLEQQLATQRLAIDTKYYRDKAKLESADPIAVLRDEAGIVASQQTAQRSMLQAEKAFHTNSEKQWKDYAKKVEGAMQGAINGMLFQHQTLRQGVANVAMVMGEEFIQEAVMKPLDKWIAAEAAKIGASLGTSTSLQAQRAADTAAEVARSVASVTRAAGVAGAQGTASFAGAPWPIDMGAPAFGLAMAATAASYGSIASAAGGWERVPIDGMMTELHKDEMVLPAHVAKPIRDMAKKGGGQGGDSGSQYHFHMTDATGVRDLMRRHAREITAGARMLSRRGHRI